MYLNFKHNLPNDYLVKVDRMSMAHSLEARVPFLDHRVVEFCTGLASQDKIRGLNEKYILKQMMKPHLPEEVIVRPKQAYRAPVAGSLLSERAPEYLREMLSPPRIRQTGLFREDTQNYGKNGIEA
jgi:asparagine synthase (glutamine-hydrolysing)